MGTRAVSGFRIDGVDKVTYSQFDGYYRGVGMDIFKYIRSLKNIDGLKDKVRKLRLIDNDSKPTEQDKKKLEKYADLSVSEQTLDDWYCLLRKCQGKMGKYVEAGAMLNDTGFMADADSWCEYAYIINLDDETFEIYRYRSALKYYDNLVVPNLKEDRGYEGVILFGSFPLAEVRAPLPNKVSAFLAGGRSF